MTDERRVTTIAITALKADLMCSKTNENCQYELGQVLSANEVYCLNKMISELTQ